MKLGGQEDGMKMEEKDVEERRRKEEGKGREKGDAEEAMGSGGEEGGRKRRML